MHGYTHIHTPQQTGELIRFHSLNEKSHEHTSISCYRLIGKHTQRPAQEKTQTPCYKIEMCRFYVHIDFPCDHTQSFIVNVIGSVGLLVICKAQHCSLYVSVWIILSLYMSCTFFIIKKITFYHVIYSPAWTESEFTLTTAGGTYRCVTFLYSVNLNIILIIIHFNLTQLYSHYWNMWKIRSLTDLLSVSVTKLQLDNLCVREGFSNSQLEKCIYCVANRNSF